MVLGIIFFQIPDAPASGYKHETPMVFVENVH